MLTSLTKLTVRRLTCNRLETHWPLTNKHWWRVTHPSINGISTPHKVTLAPGIVVEVDPQSYAAASEKRPNDLGLYEVTLDPKDRWKFKTPSLRNVALTAPFMHNGSVATLTDVVEFYVNGGIENPELSPLIQPLSLSADEKQALVDFMKTLTGDSVTALINDGMAAPIGDAQRLQ